MSSEILSSEVLLAAHGVTKVYSGTLHPWPAFVHALFPRTKNKADQHPVLRGIDLTIVRGETVGIMGRNGAGKTTLLGILGGVIEATNGKVERPGKIAALLGTTAGFNQNFSGRENAYLFCSIQGLSRMEANERLPLIEAFADLRDYFDMPIRTYSSGMQSRLAFACAIHVNADVIIIDETLAVGDANFKMKCYERINKMKESGQTFLLVSHNQNLVANFCTRGVVLEGGKKIFDGSTFEALEVYKRVRTMAMGDSDLKAKETLGAAEKTDQAGDLELLKFELHEDDRKGEPYCVVASELHAKRDIETPSINFGISNHHGIVVCTLDGQLAGLRLPSMKKGDRLGLHFRFAKTLLPGRYFLSAVTHELVGDVSKPLSLYQNVLSFDIRGDVAMSGIANLKMVIEPVG